jgi:hypothetical protein
MRVTSRDGTVIAYERAGAGPALVLVDPALGYREFDNVRVLGERLEMVLMEPPIGSDDDPADVAFTAEITQLVAAGRRREAVERFLTACGVPTEVLAGMTPSMPALDAVAHTIVYDCLISTATTTELLAKVSTPTLVLDSQGSSDDLTGWAANVAAALPEGRHRSLPGGWHGVPVEDLAPVVAEFCR